MYLRTDKNHDVKLSEWKDEFFILDPKEELRVFLYLCVPEVRGRLLGVDDAMIDTLEVGFQISYDSVRPLSLFTKVFHPLYLPTFKISSPVQQQKHVSSNIIRRRSGLLLDAPRAPIRFPLSMVPLSL